MNLELLGAFHQNYPEAPDGHLERIKKDEVSKESSCATYAITLQFNRCGNLIAIGCNDGRIEIWDYCTRRMIKYISAHVHPVCSVSWSRDSRKLLSASTDNHISIWDIITGDALETFRLPCPVLKVQCHPRDCTKILVCPLRHAPVILNTVSYQRSILQFEDDNDLGIVASFDRRGTYIYTGNSKGKVTIYNSQNLQVVRTFRCTNTANSSIKSIEFSRRGECFLINCADRVIRVYNCQDVTRNGDTDPDPSLQLRDIVTGNHWRKCCFSGDGEYICAGSMKQHSIYLWERSSGTLVKILHGQKGETLLDVVWHPLRPVIVSLSNSVTKEQVSIWAQTQVQNWSAFAPDFKELDENVEYEERESEFDIEDEDKQIDTEKDKNAEDIEVDIETIEPISALLSSDEENEPVDLIFLLSTTPEIEQPEDQKDNRNIDFVEVVTRKRLQSETEMSPKTKKRKICEIDLPNASADEVHPLVSSRKQNKLGQLGVNKKFSSSRGQRDRHKMKK
uniref:RBBP5 n=1 Tax=Schmidtea mediterranea TaxID=79327 RepID=A0A0X9DCF1_SCHMD|nr:RBBP5 [Schmidtea mediterranea]